MTISQPFLYLLARILTCGVWLPSGIGKAINFDATAGGMTRHGIPFAAYVLPFVIALELGGSILVIFNRHVSLVALTWTAFIIPATLIYHFPFYTPEGKLIFVQFILFTKNISLMGGLLALMLLDPAKPGWLRARISA